MSEQELARREDIIARLYAALDSKMHEIEERIGAHSQTGEGASAADGERDARTLTALARLLEKLDELKLPDNEADSGEASGKERDAEQIRDEIAGRLERMLKAGPDRETAGNTGT